MKLQPLEDRIVVRPLEAEETTVSGLVIPTPPRRSPSRARCCRRPGRRSEHTGELIPVDVATATWSSTSKYGGTEITVDGEDVADPQRPRRARQGRLSQPTKK